MFCFHLDNRFVACMNVFGRQPDAIRKRNKSDQIKFLIPLIYAPVLPLSKFRQFCSAFFVVPFCDVVRVWHLGFCVFLASSAHAAETTGSKGPSVYFCAGWGICSWHLFGVSFCWDIKFIAIVILGDILLSLIFAFEWLRMLEVGND